MENIQTAWADAFLEHLTKFYEIVFYSDQLNMYVDPVVERLDSKQCIRYRLSKGATKYQDGNIIGIIPSLTEILGRSFASVAMPSNRVFGQKIVSKYSPGSSREMIPHFWTLFPFLSVSIGNVVWSVKVLASYEGTDIAKEFIKRSVEHQRRMQ